MPRGKKNMDDSKKKKKTSEDDIIDDDDGIIDDDTDNKRGKKTASRKGKKSKKGDEEEDELSDLEIDIENSNQTQENNDNDVIINGQRNIQRKAIDPNAPIGELKTDDILGYLIERGNETLNPQLKFGAINLLNQLKGRRGRMPNNRFNNNMPNNNFNRNNPNGRNGQNYNQRNQQKFRQPMPMPPHRDPRNNDIYTD